MTKVTLRNDFHETEVTVHLRPGQTVLSRHQMARVCRELCGMSDCSCRTIRGRYVNPAHEYTQSSDSRGEFDTIEILEGFGLAYNTAQPFPANKILKSTERLMSRIRPTI